MKKKKVSQKWVKQWQYIKVNVSIKVTLSFSTLYRAEILLHMKNIINYL